MKKEDFITKLKMSKIQLANDILNSLSTDDVVALWNEFIRICSIYAILL